MRYFDDAQGHEIYEFLISKIENEDTEVLAKKLGYHKENQLQKILTIFGDAKNIFVFLDTSIFDFRYTSKSFLKKLFEIYNIDKKSFVDIVSKFRIYEEERLKFEGCYIFIASDFVRSGQPIFVLGVFENKRRIEFKSRDLVFKTQKQIEQYISNIVKEHYLQSGGKLELWGKIKQYIFNCQGKKLIFDTNGNIVKTDEDIFESRAMIKI